MDDAQKFEWRTSDRFPNNILELLNIDDDAGAQYIVGDGTDGATTVKYQSQVVISSNPTLNRVTCIFSLEIFMYLLDRHSWPAGHNKAAL
jgi:hypothetical protein